MFLIIARDREDVLELRNKIRAEHLDYINMSTFKVKMAGPFVEKGSPIGSCILLDAPTYEDALVWAENDPYAKSNVFAGVEIQEMKIGIWND